MDEPAPEQLDHDHNNHSSWPLKMIFGTMALAAIFFATGVAVGRGTILIHGLSLQQADIKNSKILNYLPVDEVYTLLKQNYDGNLNTTALLNGAKQGLVAAAGDPYTEFFDPLQAKAFNDELAGTISGIGAEIGADAQGNIQIISPIAGYPAAKAGLKPKDLIVGVNGQSTSGISVDAAVSKIRGPVGTKVKLTIVRDNGNPFELTITRQKITVPSVKWSESGDIGVMTVSQFTDDTVGLAKKAAAEFQAKKVKAVVLDLRGNPGGYLDGAVNISSLWLKQGQTVVSERRGSTIIDTEMATGDNPLAGLPTVVLIDGGSASASEITAGALHDNHDATLLGQTSFGKGSVQQVKDLPDGSELKVTIAHWYTPDGININKKGITPDVKVAPATATQISASNDPQLDKAKQMLQAKIGG